MELFLLGRACRFFSVHNIKKHDYFQNFTYTNIIIDWFYDMGCKVHKITTWGYHILRRQYTAGWRGMCGLSTVYTPTEKGRRSAANPIDSKNYSLKILH